MNISRLIVETLEYEPIYCGLDCISNLLGSPATEVQLVFAIGTSTWSPAVMGSMGHCRGAWAAAAQRPKVRLGTALECHYSTGE